MPITSSAHVWSAPAAMLRNTRPPTTARGVLEVSSPPLPPAEPTPSWPYQLLPQHHARPPASRPQPCRSPRSSATKVRPQSIRTGVVATAVPSPPNRFAPGPQHQPSPIAVRPQVARLEVDARIMVNAWPPATATGVVLLAARPSPSCPPCPNPQHQAAPAAVSPQLWPLPNEVARAVNTGALATRCGVPVQATRMMPGMSHMSNAMLVPSSPYSLIPQHQVLPSSEVPQVCHWLVSSATKRCVELTRTGVK